MDENGGYAQITLTRTNGTVGSVQVVFATTNGVADPVNGTVAAFAGLDYVTVTNTVTFGNGDTNYPTAGSVGDQTQVQVYLRNVSGPDRTVNSTWPTRAMGRRWGRSRTPC